MEQLLSGIVLGTIETAVTQREKFLPGGAYVPPGVGEDSENNQYK